MLGLLQYLKYNHMIFILEIHGAFHGKNESKIMESPMDLQDKMNEVLEQLSSFTHICSWIHPTTMINWYSLFFHAKHAHW